VKKNSFEDTKIDEEDEDSDDSDWGLEDPASKPSSKNRGSTTYNRMALRKDSDHYTKRGEGLN
jgi:hypothetical protein